MCLSATNGLLNHGLVKRTEELSSKAWNGGSGSYGYRGKYRALRLGQLNRAAIDYEWTTGSAVGDGLSSDPDTSRTGQGTPYFSRRA